MGARRKRKRVANVGWLAKARTGSAVPERVLLYGLPGVGKTTAAVSFPKPLVIPVEDGLVALPDVPRIESPEKGFSWTDVLKISEEIVEDKKKDDLEYETIVYDALSGLEELCWKYTCEHNFTGKKWESIEQAGYGKGYIAADRTWRSFAQKLNALTYAGLNVVLIAHSTLVKFNNPDGMDYDRYVMRLHKRASEFWFKWASDVFFMKHHFAVATEIDKTVLGGAKTKSTGQNINAKKDGSAERIVCASMDAAYDAKSRRRVKKEWALPLPEEESFYDALQRERRLAQG